jgi:membrane-associated phospholipid phosphatase
MYPCIPCIPWLIPWLIPVANSPFLPWTAAAVVFFFYTAALGVGMRGLSPARRQTAIGAAAGGLLVTILSTLTPQGSFLRDWLLPPSVLLIAYWASGALFVAPMPRIERALLDVDDRLRVRAARANMPPWFGDILELAYTGVYLLVPIALGLHLSFSGLPDPDRFWTVILVVDFVCFAALPWIQTRPPRALEPDPSGPSAPRAFNLRLLGATSIQVNTFPSGHAAEALAAALLVLDVPVPLLAIMCVAALAVAAGAVLGRYHYALDAMAGWLVAIGVYAAFR